MATLGPKAKLPSEVAESPPASACAVGVEPAIASVGVETGCGNQAPKGVPRPPAYAPKNADRAIAGPDGSTGVIKIAVALEIDLDTAPCACHDNRGKEKGGWPKLEAFRSPCSPSLLASRDDHGLAPPTKGRPALGNG